MTSKGEVLPVPYGNLPGTALREVVGVNRLIEVLRQDGVDGWNLMMARWIESNMVGAVWRRDEEPPPVIIELDFSDVNFSAQILDGIDMRFANLCGSDFQRTSLKSACFDVCAISGADFSGAGVAGASFELVTFDPENPPLGIGLKPSEEFFERSTQGIRKGLQRK